MKAILCIKGGLRSFICSTVWLQVVACTHTMTNGTFHNARADAYMPSSKQMRHTGAKTEALFLTKGPPSKISAKNREIAKQVELHTLLSLE